MFLKTCGHHNAYPNACGAWQVWKISSIRTCMNHVSARTCPPCPYVRKGIVQVGGRNRRESHSTESHRSHSPSICTRIQGNVIERIWYKLISCLIENFSTFVNCVLRQYVVSLFGLVWVKSSQPAKKWCIGHPRASYINLTTQLYLVN